jgi:hypothetical protein
MAEASVKVPGLGQTPRKYVWAGAAAVAGVAGYAWLRAGSSGGGAVVEPGVDSAGLSGDLAGGDSYSNPAPGGAVPDPTAGAAPRTNSEWTQRVTDDLVNVGYDITMIAATLGKYLDRKPLSTAEADIVRTAWAYEGRPPEGTFSIVPATTPTTGTPTTLPAPKVPAPFKPAAKAERYVSAGGFGMKAGHVVSTPYLVAMRFLRPGGKGLVFTGKNGTPAGHPFSYSYAAGLRDRAGHYFIRKG